MVDCVVGNAVCEERFGMNIGAIGDRVVVEAGCGKMESEAGMSNPRAIKLLIHVKGMYFGKFGWARCFW